MALETHTPAVCNDNTDYDVSKSSSIGSRSSNHESLPSAFNNTISKTDNSRSTLPVDIDINHSDPASNTDEDASHQAAGRKDSLGDLHEELHLPTDRVRTGNHSFIASMISIDLEDPLKSQLSKLACDQGSDLPTAMLVAWAIVLSRLSGQDSILLGFGSTLGTEALMTMTALTVDLSGEPDTFDLLERVNRTLGIIHTRNQDADGPLSLAKNTDSPSLFKASFYSHIGDHSQILSDTDSLQCYLELRLVQDNGNVTVNIRYAADFYNKETIQRYAGYLKTVVVNMATNKNQPIASFDIVSPAEKKLLLETWNNTDAPYPSNRCVHHLFEDQVEKSPAAIAIVQDEKELTYLELNAMANRIASQLIIAGALPGNNIALLFDRSIDLVASQIAVLKVGAAYVPIDTNAPVDRQTYVAADCSAKVIITNGNKVVPDGIQATVLRLGESQDSIDTDQGNITRSDTCSNDTAYVMYTSGTTGRPKGVVTSHRGVIQLAFNDVFADFGPEDRVAFVNNPSFDPSTLDVWGPLLRGASIAIIDHDTYLDPHLFAKAIELFQVTILTMTNGIFHQHAFVIGSALSKLRYLLSGAEQGSIAAFGEVLRHNGPVHLINGYGPTEVTMMATAYLTSMDIMDMSRMPIGRPISNARAYVLDKHLNPVPAGVIGELYIGGPGIATGYLNLPELTAERFLPDPFVKIADARMYKTGDLVRYLSDGNLVFLGRDDNQVKVRGFRVELGEIESQLTEYPHVLEAIVVAVGGEGNDKRLVAYIVADPDDNLVSSLRDYLSTILPEYMVPSAFVRMDTFPLTNNGKVDRHALPPPDESSFESRKYEEPEGKIETMLAEIWADLLQINRVSRQDNFFMLGGHSLMAVRMIEQMRQQGYALSVRVLFDNPILRDLAACLHQGVAEAVVPPNLIIPSTLELAPDMLPLIDLSQEDINTIIDQVPGGVANIQDIYALSPLQDGILFHHMMQPVGDTYLIVSCRAFHDKDIMDQYLAAFQKVIDRHDILRTAFIWKDLSTPAQVVLRKATMSVVEQALDHTKGPITEQLMEMYNPRKYRIDLAVAPLARFAYAQDINGRWVTIQLLHHLTGDNSAVKVMQEEIDMIMDGRLASLPSPQPYRNLIAQVRQGVSAEEHERFFKEMLHDIDSPSLPYGLSNVHGDGTNVSQFHCMLPQDLNDQLRGHAKRLGVSLASLCHLAWAQVVAATSGQSKVVFGTVLFGRMHGGAGSDRTLGLYINTLPIRIDVEGVSVVESARKVHSDLAELLDHEHASLALANQCSNVASGTPLFSSILNYRHNSAPLASAKGDIGREATSGQERTNYPIGISVEDFETYLGLIVQVAQPYEPSRVCGYMEQALHSLSKSLQQAPDASVHLLNVIPAKEYDMVINSWNDTDALYRGDLCIHQLFENQARMTPEAIAIVHDERSLTYRELNSRSNWIARLLVENGVKPGDYILLMFDRSFDLVASQIAVLKVGAAYVPIDTNAPLERQAYIASDCGSEVILTDMNRSVHTETQGTVLRLPSTHDVAEHVQDILTSHIKSTQDTAYVMYTSGSTGRPKGVMAPHCGIARLVLNNGYTEIAPDDTVAFMANPSFDSSTFEVWSALLHGARLVITDKSAVLDAHLLETLILRHQVTVLFMTSAIFRRHAFTIGRALSTLKYLFTGGEQASLDAFMAIAGHGGTCKVSNVYGPTETTTFATVHTDAIAVDHLESIPIGRAAGNTRLYVLNNHMEPVPLGVVGELYIGGPGVANGYLNRPELTAERFLPDPFANVPGARMYKTGDLVRYLPDGNLVFLGRNDDQVKIRGFRVELGEIESRLTEHPHVHEAIVLAVSEEGSDKRLVAYVVAEPREDLMHTVRQHLSDNLPEYMVPSAIVRLDAFPLTNNGKVDRRALPSPEDSAFDSQDHEEPEGTFEIMLATVWASLLRARRVGRHDNFFMLGGHSLLAVRMIEQLRLQGYVLPVRVLFDNPTICTLAVYLRQGIMEAVVPPNLITTSTLKLTPDLLPLIDLSQYDIDTIVDQVPGGIANIQDIYALSPLQDGILFHHMMQPMGDTYLLVSCSAFRDKDILDQYLVAFQKVVDRHDILRTAFIWKDLSTPAQVVLRKASLSTMEHALDPAKGPIAEQLMGMYNPRKYRINLSEAPLNRFAYAQDTDGRWITIQLLHHLIGDHSTLEVMMEELDIVMDGRVASLLPPQPYRNLIAQVRQGVSAEEHERYFKEMLHDIDSPSLPYGLSDVHGDGTNVSEFHCMLSQDLNNKLRGHAKRLGVSLASLCHLAWAQVVAATSGQSRVVFGTVLFGRMQGGAGSDRTLGLYINTLPMRIDVEGASVVESVRKVHSDLAGLLEHEHASLALANQCSAVPFGTPLFSSILNYRHNLAPSARAKKDIGIEAISGQERTNYPVDISVEDFGSSLGLTAQIMYPHDPSRVCGYMEHALCSLADCLQQAPDVPIQSLNVLPAEEYDMVIHTWNDTDAPYPDNQCIDELFENQAVQTPDSIAVVHGDISMTYSMLNKRASILAGKLIGLGIQPGDYVTIFLERSFELIIAQLAILKARAAYVPLDVNAPIDRQAFIVSDCGSKVMITDDSRDIPALFQQTVLRVSAQQQCFEEAKEYKICTGSRSSHDTAYVMYTSGSTGQPKGVMIPHQGIAREVNNGFAEPTRDDCIGFTSNPSFDPSTFEVWSALLHGARLLILDTNTVLDAHLLEAAILRHHVTSLFLTSALFHRHVFVIGHTLSKLKYLNGGGEQALVDAYKVMVRHGGPCKLINSYGPTETTVDATAFTVTSDITDWDNIPIGKPISNTKVYVLDKYSKPVPIGVVGELYVGGPGVAKGYLNRPDLTAERFLPDRFSKVQGTRMYKTGDLVRYLPDGNLVFIGRNDDQVKIRGYRVELAEIESLLVEHPHVREVVVLVIGEAGDDKRLVTYVVAEPRENLVNTLRQYLSATLPEYMIPSAIVRLDAFPLTNNGKVDRRALPIPSNDSLATSDYVSPQGDLEVALAAVWSDVLKVEMVGRHDNFFMLGGHSLLALRLINAIRTALGINVMLHVIFSAPTLSELALCLAGDAINNSTEGDEYSVLIPLQPNGCRSPLFCIHPGPGLAWSYRGLAKHLHPEQQLYGLQARGLDGESTMAGSIEEMAMDYIQQIRKVQAHGPYYLLGWSFGGKVVLNMSTILQSQGETVALLAIMDAMPMDPIHDQQVVPKLDINALAGTHSIPEEQEQNGVHSDGLSNYDEYLSRLVGDSSLDEMLAMKRKVRPVVDNNEKISNEFQASVHAGDILFFKSTVPAKGESIIDPASWVPYVSGRVEVHDVACAHVEMDKAEHIAVVGRMVAAKIEATLSAL